MSTDVVTWTGAFAVMVARYAKLGIIVFTATAIFLLEKIIDDHRSLSVDSSMIFITGYDHRVCSYDRRFEFEAIIIDDHR